MNWSDRFIKLPISVYDKKVKEVTGNEVSYESYMMLNPLEVACYRPSFDEGEPENEVTAVTTKSGETTLVYLSVQEFEKFVNEFMK